MAHPTRRLRPATLFPAALAAGTLVAACSAPAPKPKKPMGLLPTAVTSAEPDWIPFSIRAGQAVEGDPREKHLEGLRRVTSDGKSSAAVWSADGRKLLFVSAGKGASCEVVELDLGSGARRSLGPAKGTAASAVWVGDDVMLSHRAGPGSCAARAVRASLAPSRIGKLDGSGSLAPLIEGKGMHAELAASPDGKRLVFTSTRDGDAELYGAGPDGRGVERLTRRAGFDGAPQLSPDGSQLTWHAAPPPPKPAPTPLAKPKAKKAKGGKAKPTAKPAATAGPVRSGAASALRRPLLGGTHVPTRLTVMLAGAHGQHPRALPQLGRYDTTPSFMPGGRRLVVASDYDAPGSAKAADATHFDVYVIDPQAPVPAAGAAPHGRVTFASGYDGALRFSRDGRHVVFLSGRSGDGKIDLYVARWVD